MPAPIAIFAFNRPDHLRRTLEALAANELTAESHVTFFYDGPRTEEIKTDTVRTLRGTELFLLRSWNGHKIWT